MSEERWNIPLTWSWSLIGEIAEIVGGGTPSTSDEGNFAEHGIAWLTPADLTDYEDAYITRGRRDLSEQGYRQSAARLMPPGTVLFTSRAPVGYCAIASTEISTNQGFKSFVLKGAISPEYIRYYLLASVEYAESKASGTTFKELSGSRAAELSVPLAPLPEQRRIVSKIDSLSAKSQHARDHLDHVPRLVEKYKQAILAAAFRGDLTQEWRSQAGRPRNWEDTTLGQLLVDIRYGTAKKCGYDAGAVGVLRIPNVQLGEISVDDLKSADFTDDELTKLRLEEGDILIIRSNGSLDLVGRSAVVDKAAAGLLFAGYLIRLRLNPDLAHPEFVQLYLRTTDTRTLVERLAKSTSGVNNINSTQIQQLPISRPDIDEQHEIVRLIDITFAWIDRLASETAGARKLVDHLDQAMLSKAFQGELVPQDPNDEPAGVLLERIRAERATGPSKTVKRDRPGAA